MTDLLFLNGVPDDQRVFCHFSQAQQGPTYVFPGAASFLLETRKAFPDSQVALIGPGFDIRLNPARLPRLLVNHIADPDTCAEGLRRCETIRQQSGLPCFNLPERVARTSRDGVAGALQNIDGVHMPRTLRLRPRRPSDVTDTIAAEGLRYPVILRIAGDHGGRSMVKMDGPDDLDPLFSIPWGGNTLYVTEFVDYRDDDGLYRKTRLVVVGDEYFVRHRVRGDRWMIHVADRDRRSLEEESAFLAGFDREWRPRLDGIIAAIRERIGLDYFGIDCSLRPDGRVLVFEANVGMKILFNQFQSPNVWDAPIARIEAALVALLRDPTRWTAGRAAS